MTACTDGSMLLLSNCNVTSLALTSWAYFTDRSYSLPSKKKKQPPALWFTPFRSVALIQLKSSNAFEINEGFCLSTQKKCAIIAKFITVQKQPASHRTWLVEINASFWNHLIFIMLTSDLTFPASSSEIPLRENRPEVWVSLLIYGCDDFDVTQMDPLSANILSLEQMEPVREAERVWNTA